MDKIELIDRAAVLDKLPQICDALNGCDAPYNFDEHCVGCEVYMLHKMLIDLPTIDAAPVRRGEWKYEKIGGKTYCFCSECGDQPMRFEPNFCPNCGADMRKEEHHESED